jgi:hypothetical protein
METINVAMTIHRVGLSDLTFFRIVFSMISPQDILGKIRRHTPNERHRHAPEFRIRQASPNFPPDSS